MKTYAYAVFPSPGCYGDGQVSPVYCTDDRGRALDKARRMTAGYQRAMSRHGGSSGGYVAREWGRPRQDAAWADMMPPVIEPL